LNELNSVAGGVYASHADNCLERMDLGEGAAQASSARESNRHRLPVAKVKPNSIAPRSLTKPGLPRSNNARASPTVPPQRGLERDVFGVVPRIGF
jgi:hypothetical protein